LGGREEREVVLFIAEGLLANPTCPLFICPCLEYLPESTAAPAWATEVPYGVNGMLAFDDDVVEVEDAGSLL
jgi:hypothetical protein